MSADGPRYRLDMRRDRGMPTANPCQRGWPTVQLTRVHGTGAGLRYLQLIKRRISPDLAHELHALLTAGAQRLGGAVEVTGDFLHAPHA